MKYYLANNAQLLETMIVCAICLNGSNMMINVMNKYGKELYKKDVMYHCNERFLPLTPSQFNNIIYRPEDMFEQINNTIKKVFDPMVLTKTLRLIDMKINQYYSHIDDRPKKKNVSRNIFQGEIFDWANPSNNKFYHFYCGPSNLNKSAELHIRYIETPCINVFRLNSSWNTTLKFNDYSIDNPYMIKTIKKVKYQVL